MSSAVDSSVIVATPRRGRPRRQHKCQHCGKTFKRSEHCIRHERTHTLEKPFCCRYCHKSYARKDLVTRHERTLHAAEHSQSQKHGRPSEPSDNDQRAHNGHEEQEDADQVIVADRLNVNQSAGHRAMQQLPDKLPDTPPRDCEEPPDPHDDIMPRILAPSRHHLLSPVEQVALSPSPSSSTSTQTTTVQSRAGNLAWDASGGAISRHSAGSSDMPAANYMEIAHASSLARGSNGLSLEERSQLLPNDNMYGSVERSATFHPHQTDPMEIDFISSLSTGGQQQNMAPPPISRAMGSAESLEPRQDQRQYPQDQSRNPQSSLYDDSLSLFAQVEPGDIDLADFSFHPLPGQLFDLNYDGVSLQLGNNGFGAQSTAIDPSLNDRLNSTQQADAPDQNPSHRGAPPPAPDSSIHPLLKDQDPQAVSDVRIDKEAHLAMRVDLAERLSNADVDNEIPSPRLCESFLSSYITSFSCHLPIIHLPTLIAQRTPSPLILAMCSIGALYRLDRRRAQRLHDLASKAVKEKPSRQPSDDGETPMIDDLPLWYVQSRFLLSFYAIMSGDSQLASDSAQQNGFYSMVYKRVRGALSRADARSSSGHWHKWIEIESWNRLLGAMFIVSTMTMVIFDVNPGFNATEDLDIKPFSDAAIWNATSPDQWRELRLARTKQRRGLENQTLKDVLFDILIPGRYRPEVASYSVSAFSALVLMHGVVAHMWQRFQVAQALCHSTSAKDQEALRSTIFDGSMNSLARCESFLRSGESDVKHAAPEYMKETSLVFNSHAILRMAYVRLFKPSTTSDRVNLLSSGQSEMEASIAAYVAVKIEPGPHLLGAVIKSLEGFDIPVRLGHLWVRKTAAFRWSVEHAVAGWESALFVSKWVHSIEMDIAQNGTPSTTEAELLTTIQNVLQEAEYDLAESGSLAAGFARTWSGFLKDVWIWGITPQMGSTLEKLAEVYEQEKASSERTSTGATRGGR